jgi:hypothetical protein
MEFRARATLALVVERALAASPSEPIVSDSATCPNCGTTCHESRTPYCTSCCREESAFVRQFRDSLLKGTFEDEPRQVALGQKLWRILGGGMPLRVSLIPAKDLTRTLAKRANKCEVCGAPSVTVDNTGSG